jgi:hypothetical protein
MNILDVSYEEHEKIVLEIIEQRDRAEVYADELSTYVEIITGEPVGEHSNLNNPWENALEAASLFIVERNL